MVGMADQDAAQAPVVSPWSLDPTGGAVPAAPSIDLDPRFRLPASYFMPQPGADGTSAAAADVFSGQFDGGPAAAPGNPLAAAAGNLDQTLQHPGGSPVGINAGDKSLQYAPQGGIIPGLLDSFQLRPYVEGVPGMGPPGMPAPWETGH